MDGSKFRALVVTNDSSTELIATQQVGPSTDPPHSNDKPGIMMDLIKDRKGILDDDGKPVVGKVYSRVIQISAEDSKSKRLRARRGSSRKEELLASGNANSLEKSSAEKTHASNSDERLVLK